MWVDFESLIKMDGCKDSLKKLSATKVGEHISSGFAMSTISSFEGIKNKPDIYRGKDCMKRFCECLKVQATG